MEAEHEPSAAEYMEQLEQLLGPEKYQQMLRQTYTDALRQAVSQSDNASLSELYAACGHDLGIVPSTPAWTGLASWYVGRLAVVANHVVFFAVTHKSPGYRVLFDMPGAAAEVRFTRMMGTVSLTLRDGATKKKVFLTPPRYSNLTEVSAPPEGPGVSDVLDQVKGLFDAADAIGAAAGLLGETVSMFRSYRIAKVHQELWGVYFNRLKTGESAPFSSQRSPTQPASEKSQPTKARRPRKAEQVRATARAKSISEAPDRDRHRTMPGDEEEDGRLAQRVADVSGVSVDAAQAVIDLITDKVYQELAEHGQSRVPALGTFVLRKRRLPRSSETRGYVTFRPTKGFRDAVKQDSSD